MRASVLAGVSNVLAAEQQPDGSFLSLSCPTTDYDAPRYTYKSSFMTALILDALTFCPKAEVMEVIKQRAAQFLINERSPQWTYNYWSRTAPEYKALPYPEDLDDSACAWRALYRYDATLFTGSVLATLISHLTATEMAEGGPYRTWFVPETAEVGWQDVDLAVNSNVASFLRLLDISLPAITALQDAAIAKSTYTSPYYISEYPVLYAMSRSYAGDNGQAIVNYLLGLRNDRGHWGAPLLTALAVLSLLHLKADSSLMVPGIKVLETAALSGYWDETPFCFDPERDRVLYAAQSPALTVAFSLDALSQYDEAIKKGEVKASISPLTTRAISDCIRVVDQHLKDVPAIVRPALQSVFNDMVLRDTHGHIFALSSYFASLLKPEYSVSPALITLLNVANGYGWLAYTLYDDLLDGEGDIASLPLANTMLLRVISIYNDLALPPGFHRFFRRIMDRIEAANYWEITYCRLPIRRNAVIIKQLPQYRTYNLLADRSLGHALGPLAILASIQATADMRSCTALFRHYLIARQLNDDMHDWKSDIAAGRITPVVHHVIRCQYGSSLPCQIKLDADIPVLESVFWRKTVSYIAKRVLFHTAAAKSVVADMSCLKQPEGLSRLLDSVEATAHAAMHERARMREFAKTSFYTSRPKPHAEACGWRPIRCLLE